MPRLCVPRSRLAMQELEAFQQEAGPGAREADVASRHFADKLQVGCGAGASSAGNSCCMSLHRSTAAQAAGCRCTAPQLHRVLHGTLPGPAPPHQQAL